MATIDFPVWRSVPRVNAHPSMIRSRCRKSPADRTSEMRHAVTDVIRVCRMAHGEVRIPSVPNALTPLAK